MISLQDPCSFFNPASTANGLLFSETSTDSVSDIHSLLHDSCVGIIGNNKTNSSSIACLSGSCPSSTRIGSKSLRDPASLIQRRQDPIESNPQAPLLPVSNNAGMSFAPQLEVPQPPTFDPYGSLYPRNDTFAPDAKVAISANLL